MTGIEHPHELANSMLGALLGHVELVGGEEAVDRVLEEAGEDRTPAEIRDPNRWSSYRQGLALFTAAAAVLGDPDVGRKAGVELLRQYAGSEVITLLRSFGSPTEMLRMYPAIQAKQSMVTRSEVTVIGQDHCTIAVTTVPPVVRDQLFCGYTCGVLSQIPVLFGMRSATVEETECQTRGSPRCLYEVRWDPMSSVGANVEEELERLREQVAVSSMRFESLEAVARELSSAGDVDSVLETITRHAGVAVRAPRYLLVVRLAGDDAPRIHHVGFDEQEARAVAHEVLSSDDDTEADGSRLIVDIASARTHFGRLAAFYSEGYHFLPQERSLLIAYADHAAAALETVAALDEARERNVTLSALLDLGNALAQVGTRVEVAQRVAEATPGVVGCEQAHVLLWDAADAVLTRAASHPPTGPDRSALPLALRAAGLAGRMVESLDPFEASIGSEPSLRGVLTLLGLDRAYMVPLTARGAFIGLLAVEMSEGSAARLDTIQTRLAGVASLASTALDGMNLLDEVRHQAFHDSTTDLPNTRLFEDRVNQAILAARRTGTSHAFLFVDLDRFKHVNDGHGHKAGDDLLRAVGQRLSGAVRETDTVARLGGDEFGVLLQDIRTEDDAAEIADKIVTDISQPFAVHDLSLTIGASVGITIFPQDTDNYDTVLARADSAMYRAKARGRAQFQF